MDFKWWGKEGLNAFITFLNLTGQRIKNQCTLRICTSITVEHK